MNIQQISYFIVTAQYLHFGKAARFLYIAQPALSNSIASLEKELNVKLFIREGRAVELTTAGKLFLREAIEIVDKVDSLKQKVRLAEAGYIGNLSIGMLGGLSKGDFIKNIVAFREDFTEIALSLHQHNVITLNRGLLTGEIDIGLTRSLCLESHSEHLAWHKLYSDRFSIIMKSDHPLAGKKIAFTDLADEPFIFINSEISPYVHDHTMKICATRGLVPRIAYEAPTLEIACTFIKAGLGLAMLPDCAMFYSVDGDLSSTYIEGDDCISDIVIGWNKKNDNPVVPVFLEELNITTDIDN